MIGLRSTYAYPFIEEGDPRTPSQESLECHDHDRRSYPRV